MSDPFTEWRGKNVTPYWLRDDAAADEARQLRLVDKMRALHAGVAPAKMAPHPMARTWHDGVVVKSQT